MMGPRSGVTPAFAVRFFLTRRAAGDTNDWGMTPYTEPVMKPAFSFTPKLTSIEGE